MDLTLIALLLTVVLFWALVFVARLRLSFIHVMAVILTQNLIGLYMLGAQDGNFFPVYVLEAGLLAFAVGLLGGRLRPLWQGRQAFADTDVSLVRQHNVSLMLLIVGIPVLVLAVGLYVISGAPLLSTNANEYRFTITAGSGLFWRMQDGGLPMLAVIAGVYLMEAKRPLARLQILFFIFSSATLLVYVLRGNKAGVLYGLTWLIVLMLVMYQEKIVLSRRRIVIILTSLLLSVGVIVAVTRQQLQLNTQQVIQYLAERLTLIEATGFYSTVQYYVPLQGLQYGLAQWDSVLGFLSLFRLAPHQAGPSELGHAVAYYTNYARFNVPLQFDDFTFPFTITPFGDFYADFGVPGVLVGGVLLGFFVAWLYRHAAKAPPSLWKAILIALQVEMIFYSTRGSLLGRAHNDIINWLLVAAACSCVYWFLQNFAAGPVISSEHARGLSQSVRASSVYPTQAADSKKE
jgi:oligosaccharide repeat unit polymerase